MVGHQNRLARHPPSPSYRKGTRPPPLRSYAAALKSRMIVTSSTSCQSRKVPGAGGAVAATADAETQAPTTVAKMFKSFGVMR